MRANLETGKFQFIVLMNQLDERLRNLITFVNSNSRFRILGLELDFYRHGDLDILIPHLYGAEARTLASTDASRTRGRTWTEEEFFAQAAEQLEPSQAARLRALYEWALRNGEVRFSTTMDLGGFNVVFPGITRGRFFKLLTDGTLVLPLSRLGDLEPRFRAELNAAGFVIPEVAKKPMIPVDEWGERLDAFIGAMSRVIEG